MTYFRWKKFRISGLFALYFWFQILGMPSLRAQDAVIQGVIVDADGLPIVSATVTALPSGKVTQTGENGEFSLEVGRSTQIRISAIGYKRQDVPIAQASKIILEKDVLGVDEILVTGYMSQRKADLTGAVSVIKREDFVNNPSANVMRSLQGKIPGVRITTDGNPAENVGIQFRGVTSFNSSPPLIVIDGQPVSINLRDINPNDIETVQFLKDASSASIYGSRAAGGVILVTTRKGKKGAAKVTYEGYVALNNPGNVPKMLSAEEYGRALWQATVNDGDDPAAAVRYYDYDWSVNSQGIPILNSVKPIEWLNAAQTMPSANTNWFNEGMRTGVQQNHQVSISSGTDYSNSFFSVNYYNNEGTQITSFFKRLAARLNNEYQFFNGRVKIGENLTLTNLKMRDVNSTYGLLVMPPNVPVYANDGAWGGVAMPLGMDDFANPVRDMLINKDNTGNFLKVLGSAYLSAEIINNLTFRSQFGVDYSMWYDRKIDKKWEEAGGKAGTINGVTQNNWHDLGRTWTNTLLYNFSKNQHQLDLLGGIEAFKFLNESLNGYRSGILLEDRDYAYLSTATGDQRTFNGGGNERTMLSFFAKANYTFAEKYLASATFRRDGSSVFGKNYRYGNFPSFSLGWRVKNEEFMKDVLWIDDLKLRASWGQNGNSEPLNAGKLVNIYITDINGTSYAIGGNETGSIPSGFRRRSLGNPDLKWETTTQTNFGVDFTFLNNRLYGSLDWYNKKTTGMLFEPPYIAALGEGGNRWINSANMTNKGIELQLTWAETVNDFRYSVSGNLSTYKNQINSIPENVKYAFGGNGLLDNIIGRPFNSLYGLVADGIYKTQEEVDNGPIQPGKGIGRIRYKDLDGDGVINEVFDRTWLGIRDPKLSAGLNFEAAYKNFDFSFFLQGVFGNSVHNTWKELSDFWNIGIQNDRNHPSRILDAWSPTNPDSNIPALSRRDANGEKRFSSYFVEDGSYLKMRNINLGYTFPSSVVDKIKLSNLRIHVTAQNLFAIKKTWGEDKFTGMDPENPGTGYPMPLSVYFGLNVSF
ncbi:SusC/RagA family TonB-linked outer membrane protein [Sphingobacterium cellulitidis]|uniref:SusC/RagA family TonB-linked outer membrane protein n=1 Tax=Sphingobacterium cellulitidis TaxID=1768011 RepID=UPI003C7C1F50